MASGYLGAQLIGNSGSLIISAKLGSSRVNLQASSFSAAMLNSPVKVKEISHIYQSIIAILTMHTSCYSV